MKFMGMPGGRVRNRRGVAPKFYWEVVSNKDRFRLGGSSLFLSAQSHR